MLGVTVPFKEGVEFDEALSRWARESAGGGVRRFHWHRKDATHGHPRSPGGETQNGNGQVKELEKVCDKVHMEYASGGRWDRPALQNLLRSLKPDDVLVVWKLDRLTRSLSDLLQIIKRLALAFGA